MNLSEAENKRGISPLEVGKRFPKPYLVTGKAAVERRLGRVRYSADLGRLCEREVIGLWGNRDGLKIEGNNLSRLELLANKATDRIGLVCNRRIKKEKDVLDAYREVAGELNFSWETGVEFGNSDFDELVDLIGETYGFDFRKVSGGIPSFDGVAGPEIRYYVETALVLAKEAVCQSFPGDGIVLPNVNLVRGKRILTQLDGINILDWNGDRDGFDFNNFLNGGDKGEEWGIIEAKVPFRVRFMNGERKIKKPMPWDRRELYRKLGKILLSGGEEGIKEMNFPYFYRFVYFRGTLGNVFCKPVDLDFLFFQHWMDFLETGLQGGLYGEGSRKIETLFSCLGELRDRREGFVSSHQKKIFERMERGRLERIEMVERLGKDLEKGMEVDPFLQMEELKGVGEVRLLAEVPEKRAEPEVARMNGELDVNPEQGILF